MPGMGRDFSSRLYLARVLARVLGAFTSRDFSPRLSLAKEFWREFLGLSPAEISVQCYLWPKSFGKSFGGFHGQRFELHGFQC